MSEAAHDVIAAQSVAMRQAMGEKPLGVMDVLSKMLRGMFVARPGHVLVGADFSGIEARINAWMADETWLLDKFRSGEDAYKVSYSKSFNIPIEEVDGGRKKGPQRMLGKYQILSGGYQGSVGAWLRFNPDPTEVTGIVRGLYFGSERWKKAADQYDRLKYHNGLSADQWIAIKIMINAWRDAHPRIVQSWFDRQDAAIEAVENPGVKVDSVVGRDGTQRPLCGGRISYLVTDGFLWCRLPSGKLLAYAQPRLVEKKDDFLVDEEGNAHPTSELEEDEIEMRVANGWALQEGRRRVAVAYFGKNQKTNSWGTQYLYGGSQTNNDCQGTARELLRFAMMNVERAGLPVVMHVHDELVSEVPEHLANEAETRYTEIMQTVPPWLEGLPLAVSAWTDVRYVK